MPTQPASPAWLRETPNGITLAVRAQPGAKRTAIVGIYGEGESAQLKIAVQAPPVEGRANDALIDFLARKFNLPKSSVQIVTGELSRSKVFVMSGVSIADAIQRLAP
ncbi:MAG: YggU family protein [Acidobacteriota bacterium]|nr:YggU family protein [Acidobacteriota bacterium]